MPRVTIPSRSIILVCDGSKALFYQNEGTATAVALAAVETIEEKHPPTRDLGTDRPGRTIDATDGSRSSVWEVDLHRLAEEKFLLRVASRLVEIVRSRRPRALIVAAPPRALGVLRERLAQEDECSPKAEIAKDLVKTPKRKLEQYLQALEL